MQIDPTSPYILLRRAIVWFVLIALPFSITIPHPPVAHAALSMLTGPTGSGAFGTHVVVLSNGNFVVTDPFYDAGSIVDVGAVYLFNGATGAQISVLTGSSANDLVGFGGVTALPNGNYIVGSPAWKNGSASYAGAVTWSDGVKGVSGVVSASNSLVGSSSDNFVGNYNVWVLPNGNYFVRSPNWDNGTAIDAGAVTWGNGTTGVSGVVSASNSLVGNTAGDQVGLGQVQILANSNYVIINPFWDNGAATDVGAVTWGNGTSGSHGLVSTSNSLVGSTANDRLGYLGVTALTNGNYVVSSPFWHNGTIENAGAVTWSDGSIGIIGAISVSNSLIGKGINDQVGFGGVTALTNGNYVVRSPYWNNSAIQNAGAVTWGNGTTGITGQVSASNSLVGNTAGDQVGFGGVIMLTNSNYIISSPNWDNGTAMDAGAVTWGSSATGISGTISMNNSLVGDRTDNNVGRGELQALLNGNYIVNSPFWDNGVATDAGAVTWGNGTSGSHGVVGIGNSLVGSTTNDWVGNLGVTALTNGNYVIRSPLWDNGAAPDVGAATWGNGSIGTSGVISVSNSLVGSTANDQVSSYGVTELSNGNYIVSSPLWDNGAVTDAGAATWGNGSTGTSGVVSVSNSLVGSTAHNLVSSDGVLALNNGNYVVSSSGWDNGTIANVGAVTWRNGVSGIQGVVSASNSLVGDSENDLVSLGGVKMLPNGDYLVNAPFWDNGTAKNAGAMVRSTATSALIGLVSTQPNLLAGMVENGGFSITLPQYDPINGYVAIGFPKENKVKFWQRLTHYTVALPMART